MSEDKHPDVGINITLGIIALFLGIISSAMDSIAGAIFFGLMFIGSVMLHIAYVNLIHKDNQKEG